MKFGFLIVYYLENSPDAVIYKSVSINIDVKCSYDGIYEGIEVDNINIVSENTELTDSGDGKFSFTLTQYMDSDLTDAAEPGEQTPLGSDLYFQLVYCYTCFNIRNFPIHLGATSYFGPQT